MIDDKLFSVQSYSIVREDSFRHYIPDNICYAYTDFPDNKKKIYSPYDKKLKFCGNITAKDIGNINNIPVKGEKLIITKSYKDCRVLRNLGYTSIWNQNEGMIPPLYLLQDLSDRFNDIIIFYDNDNAGINAGIKLKQTFANIQKEVSVYYIPLTYKVKDISDFYARY